MTTPEPGPEQPLAFGRLLYDQQGRFSSPESAALTVADRYGQVSETSRTGASHQFPTPHELAEWLKFLGTPCPE